MSDATPATHFDTSDARRRVSMAAVTAFARLYLAGRFTLPWSTMHRELAEDLAALGQRPLRLAVAAPDGYGKSSLLSFAAVIWALATRRSRFIVLGSSTRSAAGELMRAIDHEIRHNTRLRSDYPHLATVARSSGASGSRASPPRDLYVAGVARLTTIGPTTSLSELSFDGAPPDLVILDEFEPWSLADGAPAEQVSQGGMLLRRVRRQILDRSTEGSVVVTGVPTHAHGLMDRLLAGEGSGEWTKRVYKVVQCYPKEFDRWFEWAKLSREDQVAASRYLHANRFAMTDGADVLWPQRESFEELMMLRAERGWAWFDRYRQCLPPGGCLYAGFNHQRKIEIDGAEDRSIVIDDAGYTRDWRGPSDAQVPTNVSVLIDPGAQAGRPLPSAASDEPDGCAF